MNKTPRLKSWSMSRLEKYEQCPAFAKYTLIDKLCPKCFDGRVNGGFETPAICDGCGKTIEKGEALERGTEIGKHLEEYILGTQKSPPPNIRHPKVKKIAKAFRDGYKKNPAQVAPEVTINLDHNWRKLKLAPGQWSPDIWLIVKLDVLRFDKDKAEVVDWKTGGLDKNTGKVRSDKKYDDQLDIYATAVLSAFPEIEMVEGSLVFVDVGPAFEPVVTRPSGILTRQGLAAAQKRWTAKVLPLLSDRSFMPKQNWKCQYCDFRKAVGGPCQF